MTAADLIARLAAIRAARQPIGYDLEGNVWISCQAFAESPSRAFVIVTDRLGLDSAAVWQAITAVLEDPLVPKWTWNAAHELTVLKFAHGINLRGFEDGMAAWFERWPELPRGLKYAASILTRQPCWTEGISFDEDGDLAEGRGEEFWRYNCLGKGNLIVTDQGRLPIDQIVSQRLPLKVLSYNEATYKREWKPVTGWHRTVVKHQDWLRIRVAGNSWQRGLVCTPDHEILTQEGWLPASLVEVGNKLLLPDDGFHQQYFSALLGTALGDSSITRTGNLEKFYLACSHVKKELCDEKRRLFGGTVTESVHKSGYAPAPKAFYHWYLPASIQLCQLNAEIKAPLTLSLLNKMSNLGLALWYMDDGCQQRRKNGLQGASIFCLQGFDGADKEVIARWFTERFGRCWLTGHGSLVLSNPATQKLCKEIGRFIIPEYRYKLPVTAPDYAPCEPMTTYCGPLEAEVTSVSHFKPGKSRGYSRVRYCLSVEGNHNFFTVNGLVSNCTDAARTLELALHKQLQLTGVSRERYEMRLRLTAALSWASIKGIRYDADAASAIRAQLEPQLYAAQSRINELAGVALPATEPELLAAAARRWCKAVQLRKFVLPGQLPPPDIPKIIEALTDGVPPIKKRKGKPKAPPQPLTWDSAISIAKKDGADALARLRTGTDLGERAELLGLAVNVKSNAQVVALLNRLGLPKVFKRGERGNDDAQTKDADALLNLYLRTGHPVTTALLETIALRTRLQELDRKLDQDGRIRCMFNSCGTETDRTVSHKFLTGSGGNLQTVPRQPVNFRRCYVPDLPCKNSNVVKPSESVSDSNSTPPSSKDLPSASAPNPTAQISPANPTDFASHAGSSTNAFTADSTSASPVPKSTSEKPVLSTTPSTINWEWWKADYTGADAWTVAARCASLGDDTMLRDLQAGLRIPTLLGLALEGVQLSRYSRDDLAKLCAAFKRDWRDIAFKRAVYGSAYGMTPKGIRRVVVADSYAETGTPRDPGLQLCARIQAAFMARYWGIQLWHRWVATELKRTGTLTSASGLTREFFGRRIVGGVVDESTLKEAYAFEPQANTTYCLNRAVDALWTDPENRDSAGEPIIQVLLVVHDEGSGQSPADRRDWVRAKVRAAFERPLTIGRVTVTIPVALKFGSSWGTCNQP